MERVNEEESCLQKSISFRPKKIYYPFNKLMKEFLNNDNLGQEISILVVYFIKNYKNKNFIKQLKQIKDDIVRGRIQIPIAILT